MDVADNGNETWLTRRFGTGSWTGMTGSQQAAWGLLGLAGSALLLAAFYGVLHQSLDRAQQHWAQAQRAELSAQSCIRSRPAGDGCATGTIDSVSLRTGSALPRSQTTPATR